VSKMAFTTFYFYEVEVVAGLYGKGYPGPTKSFIRARHAQPLYALRARHPPNGCLGGSSPTGQAACGRLLPPWIPHAVRAWVVGSEKEGGDFNDQGDAKWIVIRGQLRGHNVRPFGRPTPSTVSGPGVGRSSGVFGVGEPH
jgi:hypothetical protein